jgi:acyl-coenzyme A synthetase/AMP-(fatty) acid ligase
MLNVSGHLLSTADVESVLIEHPLVAETAVVARPHPVKGECLYCFITVKDVSQVIPSSFSPCSCYKEEFNHHLGSELCVVCWYVIWLLKLMFLRINTTVCDELFEPRE